MPGRGIFARRRGGPAQPAGPAGAEAVREQLQRVLADPLFHNSKRYSSLLRFIVDRTLDGHNEDLKERIIGIEVFDRSPDYDTSLDPTVRVTAIEVRRRLSLYYMEPARERELRIEVPKRAYVAEFRLPEQTPLEREPGPLGRRKLWYVGAPVAAGILALAAWALPRALSPGPVIDQFWAPVLSGPGPVVFYVSSPFGGAPIPPQPSSPPASADSGMRFLEFVKRRGEVPMTDVSAASSLSSFLQRRGRESVVRPARGASLADLRLAPAVLLGSYNNDWVVRLGDALHFRFRRESEVGLRWIEDGANPASRNWAVDLSAPYGQVNADYALIARVLDQTTGRWLIVIGGLTGFGTSAACEMAMDPKAMVSLGARLPKDWASKNLQVVLAVKLVQGSPGVSQVVATRSW